MHALEGRAAHLFGEMVADELPSGVVVAVIPKTSASTGTSAGELTFFGDFLDLDFDEIAADLSRLADDAVQLAVDADARDHERVTKILTSLQSR